MKRILVLAFFLFGALHTAFAQGNLDESLAAEYYQKGEYDKAAMLYKRLLDDNSSSAIYYESYLNCLLKLKDYETAEKELKKLVKKSRSPLIYQVDLGYIYSLEGDEKKANNQFDDIIKDMEPVEESIRSTAAAFQRREKWDYSIKAFEEGRKKLHDPNAFVYDLSRLYGATKSYAKMFDEYMHLLEINPYEFENVKEALQEVVMQDEPYELFKKILLKKTQSEPDNLAYSDMLTWLFVQRKDFGAAFIQAKAIDKRQKEGGRRLIELARIVANYGEYELAERIFQSVIDQGMEAAYYVPAQRGMLDIKYARVTLTGRYTAEDIASLIKAYGDFLDTYGMTRQESGEVVLRLAEIQAQYGNQVQNAIGLLKRYIETPGIEKTLVARAKLALGDYLLLAGESWDATLYYSQVEKMFKDDAMGHEAKFRNAKLSFYRGEFEWAKAQLDVLKSSTSELIANNAMSLALLIQDNIGMDTTEKPLKLYAEADFYIFKNMFTEAEAKLDTLNTKYPNHTLADEVLMARADIAYKKQDFTAAVGYYEKVYKEYGTDILGDDALYKAAQLYDHQLNNPDEAKKLYEKLITEYPGSVYAVDARARYRILRGDVVN
jgi:tetratricopeptide (TPR) repeat protein